LSSSLIWVAAIGLVVGCNGQILDSTPPDTTPPDDLPDPPGVEAMSGPPLRSPGARRLSRQEVTRSLRRLLGADVPADTSLLPSEKLTPFDNDVSEQSASMLVVESMEAISGEVAAWAVATPARLQGLLPCTPAGPADEACFGRFLDGFGRRVLRRPLGSEERAEMLDLIRYGRDSGRFADAVAMGLRLLLMHPEFIYRVEPGVSSVGGRTRLSGYEVASRLSFLLQGMTPDDTLLAAAEDGSLDTPEGRRSQAERLISSEEGKEQVRRFHAFWLGYSRLDATPLLAKLRRETDALVDQATEAARDYRHLFLADETYIDGELAAHYGLAGDASPFGWIGYADEPRRGILSHGLFAAAGSKFDETSPTRRGKFVRERLLCQTVQLPAAGLDVDVDVPPEGSTPDACKVDRYREHRENPDCATCHALMDPIGFGLENFDLLGRYRTHDEGRPECPIDGVGRLDDETPFTGARELAVRLAESPRLLPCVTEHFLRFAAGRGLEEGDGLRAQWLAEEMDSTGNSFAAMLLAYVSHENFRYREE
jgi:Protein of unknown function (DUF1588)/Protein of unknown function (DUF1592)/Protein of unknown function (DUF1595)/Protein of unknown function (DUF1585)/Protein of unknown function (DUF1587)